VLSADHILTPAERSQLAGALAVDMESAWLADSAGGRPLAVLRVVLDAAGRRLADPRIAVDGVRALRSLRRCSSVLAEWAQE
jgi:4-hydroxy-3-methylbut-2-enyl diphosphate reductase